MKTFVVAAALLQVAMVLAGHFNEFVLLHLSAALGVGIPLVVAFFYGRKTDSMKSAVWGGVVVGFIGAALGIGLAIVLGDQNLMLLSFGPASSAVTGATGSAVGFMLRSAKGSTVPA